jgi:hypothetical protein
MSAPALLTNIDLGCIATNKQLGFCPEHLSQKLQHFTSVVNFKNFVLFTDKEAKIDNITGQWSNISSTFY